MKSEEFLKNSVHSLYVSYEMLNNTQISTLNFLCKSEGYQLLLPGDVWLCDNDEFEYFILDLLEWRNGQKDNVLFEIDKLWLICRKKLI